MSGGLLVSGGLRSSSLTGLQAGDLSAGSTDAVNGAQLYATNQRIANLNAALGGGAGWASDGAWTPPDYKVQGSTYHDAGSAFAAIDQRLGHLTDFDPLGRSTAAMLGGGASYDPASRQVGGFSALINGATYTNVTSALNAIETQIADLAASIPVRYSQPAASPDARTATPQSATTTDPRPGPSQDATLTGKDKSPVGLHNVAPGALNANSTDAVNGAQLYATNQNVTNLTNAITNGTIGLLQQTGGAHGALTAGAQTGGTSLNVAGTDGNRVVSGVAAGAVNAKSTDAVNGAQLYAAANSVASALGGGARVNGDGSVAAPSYTVAGKTYHNVGDALAGLSARGDNAVQYDMAGGARQNSVTLAGGSSGPVALHNVAAGVAATDAVNVQQLDSGLAAMSARDRAYTDAQVAGARRLAASAGSAAMAAGGLAFSDEARGEKSAAIGLGTFRGSVSVAAGAAWRVTDAVRLRGTVSWTPDTGDVGSAASVSLRF
ncbi:MAG: YadA-like family protein [Kiritimatiellia bacterium]